MLTPPPLPAVSVPCPPLNITHNVIHLSQREEGSPDSSQDSQSASRRRSRQAANPPLTAERQEAEPTLEPTLEPTTGRASPVPPGTDGVNQTAQDDWLDPSQPSLRDGEEEFVNGVVPEYEDSNEPGSAMDFPSQDAVLPPRLPPVLLELRWLPPPPPSSYDGFNIYIYRDGMQGGGA